MTRVGYIEIKSKDPEVNITVMMSEEQPIVTGGFGGWTHIPRPKRSVMTEWAGRPGLQMEVGLMFDKFDTRTSIESDLDQLEKLAKHPNDFQDPPIVTVDGSVPYRGKEWVINDLIWGAMHFSTEGRRTRQQVTVVLLEHIRGEQLAASPAKRNRDKKGGAGKATIYVVKKGDTLSSIAARKLGKASRWGELAKLNDIRDPKSIDVGQRIKVPSK